MDCYQAREVLWPPDLPRVASGEVLEARRHVEECEACSLYFAQDRLLLDAYGRLRRKQAPPPVRERVFDTLAHERAGRKGISHRQRVVMPFAMPLKWLSVAAVMTIAVVGVSRVKPFGQQEPEEAASFVEDYIRRAVSADRIASSDPTEVSSFLVRELGISHTPFELDGLHLAGAEVCFVEGRRGAMISYERDGQMVSHYLIPREGVAPRPPSPSEKAVLGDRASGSPAVVTWATPSLEQALVGSLEAEQLLQLVIGAGSVD